MLSAVRPYFGEACEPNIWLFVARRHVDYGRLHSAMCPVG